MPAISATAPGKIILLGEHAVVYGQPAIAIPVTQVKAKAIITADPRGPAGRVHIQAPVIELEADLQDLPRGHPIAAAVEGCMQALGLARLPACTLRITSTIPVASGLGSGAAVSVVILRALSTFVGNPLSNETINAIAFEVDKIYHGTPSGIDNTVITYARPVYFVRGQPIELLQTPQPFTIVIGNTGIASPTLVAVGDVRRNWQDDPESLEPIFEAIGEISHDARRLIASGEPYEIGSLMTQDHQWLQELGVSSPELDRLVGAALDAGAEGAKLSGGGRGGNMIALVSPQYASFVAEALVNAGASQTIITSVRG